MKAYAGVAAVLIVTGCSTRQGNVSAPVTSAPVTPTISQPVSAEPALTLKYNPPPNSVLPYAIVTMMSDGGQQMKTQIDVTERLIKSEPNRFTSEAALTGILQNGIVPPGIAEKAAKYKLTIVRDGEGKVVESSAVAGKGLIEPGELESETSFALPTKPFRVGDSWTRTSKLDGKPVKQTFKVDSFGAVAGRDCVFFSETDQSGDGTTLPPKGIAVDKKTGELVRSVFDLQRPEVDGKPGPHMRLEVLLFEKPATGTSPAAEKPG